MRFIFNEKDQAVQEYLNENRIEYSFVYCGVGNKEAWEFDLFRVFFKRGKIEFNFEFRTGIGHRIIKRGYNNRPLSLKGRQLNGLEIFNDRTKRELKKHRLSLGDNNKELIFEVMNEKYLLVPAPTAANVLHSLVLEMDCLEYNFLDWCENLGYNSDSIKDLNIYNESTEQSRELKQIFNNLDIENLRELLQDY